jgi:hypothetical protein
MRPLRHLTPALAPALTPALSLALSLVLVAGCGSGSTGDHPAAKPTATKSASPSPSPTPEVQHVIKVVYDPPTNQDEATAQQILQLGGTDGVAEGFSKNFAFPVDLTIHAQSGDGSPYYDPATKTVNLFYGFVIATGRIIRSGNPRIKQYELGKEWAAVDGFILIHELGHAFVDVFEIPITGREEDAVDDMATVFFTDNVDGGAGYAFDAANFFHLLQGVQGEPDAAQFQDEHSLSVQRAYDIACAVAGSSDATMQAIYDLHILSNERLQRCPAEYAQKSRAWTTLLRPHLRSQQSPSASPDGGESN